MAAVTYIKLIAEAKKLIPRFYREDKGASDWWHAVKIDGKVFELNFTTHDPEGTGSFPKKKQDKVKIVAYPNGIDGKFVRLGYFQGMRQTNQNPKRCWKGYAPVRGKKPYSKGSCRKVRGNPAKSSCREIYDDNWDDKEMILVVEKTLKPVCIGQKVKDFRGDSAVVTGGYAPRTPPSSGRVSVKQGRGERSYYPNVYGMKWVPSMNIFPVDRATDTPRYKINPNPASFSEFRTYLTEILIPDLRDSEMNSTADDFETASYYLTRGRDKKYPAWRNFIMKTLVPDLKESGQVMTAKDFVTAVKYIDAGRSVVKNPPAGYHTMPDGRVMADSAHTKNPPPIFKSGGFIVVRTYKDGRQEFSKHLDTMAEANQFKKYFLKEDEKLMLYRGARSLQSVEILPHTEVLRNPASKSTKTMLERMRTRATESQDQGDYSDPSVSIVYKAKYTDLGWQGVRGSVEKFANSLGGRGDGGGTDMRTGLRDVSFTFKTRAGAIKFAAKMKPYAIRIFAGRYNHDTMKNELFPIGEPR